MNGKVNTVYLDFIKSFDKVNNKTVLKKTIKNTIGGNIGRWIK